MAAIRKRTWKNADGVESTRWFVDIRDGNGGRERKQFDSRKEADAYRVATENQMRAGTFRGKASTFTVKDAAVRFLEHCEGRRQRGERMTRQNYKTMDGHIGNYICRDPKRHEGKLRPSRLKEFDGGIGNVKLSQLTTRSVSDFRDRLRDAGVGVVTTRKIYPVHSRSRKSLGEMIRKLSVTESQNSAHLVGTSSLRKVRVASANSPQVS